MLDGHIKDIFSDTGPRLCRLKLCRHTLVAPLITVTRRLGFFVVQIFLLPKKMPDLNHKYLNLQSSDFYVLYGCMYEDYVGVIG